MKEIQAVKDLFAEWKKNDKPNKDLINCLPRQAFPEKLPDAEEAFIGIDSSVLY